MGNACSNSCGEVEGVNRRVSHWARNEDQTGIKPIMFADDIPEPANANPIWTLEEQAHQFNTDNRVQFEEEGSPHNWNHYDRDAAAEIAPTYQIEYGLANEIVLDAGEAPKTQMDMGMFKIQKPERQRTNVAMDDLFNANVQAYMQQPDKDGKVRERVLDYTTYNVDNKKDLIMYRKSSMVSLDTSDHFDFVRMDTERSF